MIPTFLLSSLQDHTLAMGQKAIFHLEAFVVKAMSVAARQGG